MTLPSLDFYCDESSFTASKYAAVSGIAIQSTRVSTVNAELAKLKASRGKREASEIKWEKINKHDLPLYDDAVKYFFSLLDANIIHYHVVICDFHAYDHRILNKGSKAKSVSKTYYQLLLYRCCRLYGDRAQLHVRPDTGDCTRELPAFLNALNSDARRRFSLREKPVLSINPTSSTLVNLMQLNDVILGAITFHRNGRHLKADASPHKSHLAENVRSGFGVPNFAINTPWEGRRATVWNWKEQKLGRPRS